MNKKLFAVFLGMVLIFTSIFPSLLVFAADDEYNDDAEEVLSEETVVPGASSGSLDGYKGLVAHWKFDGDLKDSSPFGNDGEAVGGKNGVSFVNAVDGKGVKLDGKSYISVKDSAALDITDEFTFSFWVYKDDMRKKENMDGGVPYVMKNPEPDGDFPYGVYEWWELTPGFTFCDENGADDIHSEKQLDFQKWAMLTATYDGSTMKIYINDELVKSELISTSFITSTKPLYIGFGHFMTVDNYFKGILDDMKIYNKALDYSDVEDLYSAITSKAPGRELVNRPNKLVAYYKFENNLKDLSGFQNDGVAVKANNFKYIDGIAGKAVKFSGSSYIEVKDSDSLDLDRGFTFGTWVYREKNDKNQPIFSKYGQSNAKKDISYSLIDWNNGQRLSLSKFEDEGNIFDFDTELTADTADGRWFYYTATYNGNGDDAINSNDANTVKIYINGKLVSTREFEGDISNASGPLWIGGTTESIFFKGAMDEFRIYNYALTPTEVSNLYKMRDSLEVLSSNKNISLGSLKSSQSLQLTVNLLSHSFISPTNALPKGKDELLKTNVTTKATYKSNNPKVVAVSASGKLSAVGKGSADITIQYGAQSKVLAIKVK